MLMSMRPNLPLCLLALCAAAHAENPVLPTVTTELKRDGGVMAYGRINELLTQFRRHGEGEFRMDFRVDAAKAKQPLADIRLAVRSDDADYPIQLDGEGRFDLPVLPEAEGRTADIATNVPKGQMAIRGSIELTATPDDLDLARVRKIRRIGHTLRDELLPWYLRWLFPRIEGVRVCSPTPTWELTWRENGQLVGLPLPHAPAERDPETKKGAASRPCALLTGQENWPDAARLVAPAGSKLSVKLQGL
jgi:hypothetical protein